MIPWLVWIVQKGAHYDDEDIQAVPQVFEVVQAVQTNLQSLLYNIVEHEEAEGHFTQPNKAVPAGRVANQTHSLELPGGDGAPCGWELNH